MSILYKKMSTSDIIKYFLLAIVLVTLFVSNNKYALTPHLHNNPVSVTFFILAVGVTAIFVYRENIYVDLITCILLSRLFLYLLPLSYNFDLTKYLGNYFSVIASVIAYFIASQHIEKDLTRTVGKLFTFMFFVICIQVVVASWHLKSKFGAMSTNFEKSYTIIPAGASNYIACFLLPIMVYILFSKISMKFKLLVTASGVATLLFIKSKNSLLVLMLFFVIILLVYCYQVFRGKKQIPIPFIKSEATKVRIRKWAKYGLMISIIVFFVATIFIAKYLLAKWNTGMNNKGSLYKIVNSLTSGRITIFVDELDRFRNFPIFGNGLAYGPKDPRSHNWIIDLLAQVGVVGFTVFMAGLVLWIRKIKEFITKDKFILASALFILTMLIQGLAEISLFTYGIDVLFWGVIGLTISRVNYLKGNKQTVHSFVRPTILKLDKYYQEYKKEHQK